MPDAFMMIIRWVHVMAAVAWVGGGIFYWIVLRPALSVDGIPLTTRRFIAVEFGQIVTLCMWALVITGGILAFTRLSDPVATSTYAAILALKVALSAWMFFLAITRRRRAAADGGPSVGKFRTFIGALGHINMTVVLGLVVFFISEVLRHIFELG